MIGPGKYDDLCTQAREQAGADGVILIIMGGKLGSGFCAQTAPDVVLYLPELLETIARQIRADYAAGSGLGH